jgi:hypothetical protein
MAKRNVLSWLRRPVIVATGAGTAGFLEINNATGALRAAAAGRGDTERMSMWAGQGYRSARDLPAADIIAWLSGEDAG